ncbi:hypothetical protein BYT27DRAFT_7341561 [Phlegmacium glaucopus]|nr:hypothetical protein BYT27DRAFT_7341561 [Phlegmacium glaucopus]
MTQGANGMLFSTSTSNIIRPSAKYSRSLQVKVAHENRPPLQAPPTAQQPAQGQVEQLQAIDLADAARKPDDPSLPTVEKFTVNKTRSKPTKNGEVSAAALPENAIEAEIPQPPRTVGHQLMMKMIPNVRFRCDRVQVAAARDTILSVGVISFCHP